MLRAWQRVFEGLDVAGPALPHVAASTGESNRADVHVHGLPTTLAIGDPVISLGVGAKVVSALNRFASWPTSFLSRSTGPAGSALESDAGSSNCAPLCWLVLLTSSHLRPYRQR